MALGLYLSEEVKWSTDGAQLTLGSWEYKPPAAHDIPLQLNVEFEDNIPNPAKLGTLRSKASGEPPMALGTSHHGQDVEATAWKQESAALRRGAQGRAL